MKELQFEYGEGHMAALVPDETTVFVPGETIADPAFLPDPIAATLEAIENPVGMRPLAEQVGQGSQIVIVFPDIVKGGEHETAHRRVAIPAIIEQCLEAGVDANDIQLICSNGLHRKNTKEEIRGLLGDETFNRFWWSNQITNHDSEDWDNLVDLGRDEMGSRVIVNRAVLEADLTFLVGHVLGNPYGGYSGGYKHCATGITNWRSIAAHHVPDVMHGPDFTPVSSHSVMRHKFDAIGKHMESEMKRPFFTVDAVLDTSMRQIAVLAGYTPDVQRLSHEIADARTYVPFTDEKFDVMMFGMPQAFHYGNGHGTNPLLMLQAISANIVRHKRVMSDNCVVICSSICNGYFHDEIFPSYRPVYELFQSDYNNTLPDLDKYSEYLATDDELIRKYRYNYAYHPYHAFSMISCGHIAEQHCSAIYIVGAYEPGYARSMGMKTRATFEEALADAERYVGSNPRVLALPRAFRTAAVHLTMSDGSEGRAGEPGLERTRER